MTKKYQTEEIDTSRMAVPEQVSVAMSEVAQEVREGLLALAVGTCQRSSNSLVGRAGVHVIPYRGVHVIP